MNKLPVRLSTQLNLRTASGRARSGCAFSTAGTTSGMHIAAVGVTAAVCRNSLPSPPNKSPTSRKMRSRQDFGILTRAYTKDSAETGLSKLRALTIVNCDCMDHDAVRKYGPFCDCTSNQAIAYAELQKEQHHGLIEESIQMAREMKPKCSGVTKAQLAVEIAMVKLQLKGFPIIEGSVHVQTNPYYSYSTKDIVRSANRIHAIFRRLRPLVDSSRICIKVPSTWEGIQACLELESKGIRTLATTIFSLEQAVLAAEACCKYIAPYVNELRVHLNPKPNDDDNYLSLCVQIQRYYERHNISTQVIPASLTSVDEILALAGVQHITISPALLMQLDKPLDLMPLSLFTDPSVMEDIDLERLSFIDDEPAFRMALARSRHGRAEAKLIQAINIFCDMQTKLEEMMS